jgi:hypothetical protein
MPHREPRLRVSKPLLPSITCQYSRSSSDVSVPLVPIALSFAPLGHPHILFLGFASGL